MEKLTEKKKELLREFVDHTCEECHKTEFEAGKLQPHRVKQGGEYSLRNIKMCCPKCHGFFSSAQNKAMGITG
jgi:predicted nucleic-acid-binding Zn-ribbon protein